MPRRRGRLSRGLRGATGRVTGTVGSVSIMARVLGAVGLLAVLITAAFVVVLLAVSNLRGSTNEQARANRVTTATLRLERVVDGLDRSLRNFVLTRNTAIRAGWDRARFELPAAEGELERAVAAQPTQRQLVRSLISEIRSYAENYGRPLLAIAVVDASAAQSPTATREGLLRIGSIRQSLSRLLSAEDDLITKHASSARSRANAAVLIGVLALGVSGLLLIIVSVFLAHAVARPVREAASGASRIAGGDLTTRIPEGGPAEISELTTAFNSMAASIEHGRKRLETQNEQLRESERAKSELIAIVSHELRTPLASILGYTGLLLKRDPDPSTLQRYVEIIHDQGDRLARLVEEFLLAEETNQTQIEIRDRINLGELVSSEVELASQAATGHELLLQIPDSKLEVLGDRQRLAQVLANLLTNAIKYSPDGGSVWINASQTGPLTQIRIQDQGIGIAQEHQPRVFTKFFRGEAKESGIPGVGLGLAVSREIIEAHGGRIGFTSTEGKGSTFWIELPTAPTTQTTQTQTHPPTPNGCR
jgi:signal transduction histidine kinase